MTLSELNALDKTRLKQALTQCCGSTAWVEKMAAVFPVENEADLLEEAGKKWQECGEADWLEAFSHHPKIGDLNVLQEKFASTRHWAAGEQASVNEAAPEVLEELLTGNKVYEEKFGFIFIVFASGKSAGEMLYILQTRLLQSWEDEIKTAMNEQHKITIHRLQKLLKS